MANNDEFLKPGSKDVRYERIKKTNKSYTMKHKFKDEEIELVLEDVDSFEDYSNFADSTFNVVLISPRFNHSLKSSPWELKDDIKSITNEITELSEKALRILKSDGTLLIHHAPAVLPYVGHDLNQNGLRFRYWIVLKRPNKDTHPIHHHHEGILMYFLNHKNFHYNIIKEPHKICKVCNRHLKDWGGKKHLMNPEGSTISDIWDDISFEGYENDTRLPIKAIDRLLDLVTKDGFKVLLAPYEGDLDG